MESNRMSTAESQAQPEKSRAKNGRRQLDHLSDLQDAMVPFTMVPRPLSEAWLNNDPRMPDKKFKILYTMLSQGSNFTIKRKYLLRRFDKDTISKYMKELIAEGYIRMERVPAARGGWENLHHVNPIAEWDIVRNPVEEGSNRPAVEPTIGSIPPLNENKVQPKKEKTKPNDDEIPRDPPPMQDLEEIPPPDLGKVRQKDASSSSVRDVFSSHKPEDLRPSDYVNMIASKIKSAKIKDGKVTWVPQIELANKAAADFLKAHGHEMMRKVCQTILEKGRLTVCGTMFFDVLPYIDQDSGVDLSLGSR